MKHILFIIVLVTLVTFDSAAQKVKYKDLYVLLRAENYSDADPYLRKFIVDDPEEAHALYSMGKMLQSYLAEGDLLNSSDRLLELADSSLIYFNQANELTTEKYVKKHDDDYFEDFRRRDMRTGKFEVKISDVQLDIENRILEVEKFKLDLNLLLLHFTKAQENYGRCQAVFDSLSASSETLNLLYFTSEPEAVKGIKYMAVLYDSSLYHLNTYRSLMKGMGKAAVEQKFETSEITSYPDDGKVKTDFFSSTIHYKDYKTWALTISEKILREISPLKKRIITYDQRVAELHDHVVIDSLDKRDEVFQLATENVGRDLRDYDPNNLPAALFNYRLSEINYHSAINYWLREVADTIDIGLKLDMLMSFSKQMTGMKKLLKRMEETNNTLQHRLFSDYITTVYTDIDGLSSFIKDQEETVNSDSAHLWQWIASLKLQDQITVWHSDSISLVAGKIMGVSPASRYSTVVIDSLGGRTLGFYTWKEQDSVLTFVYGVSPSNRAVDSLYSVAVNQNMVDHSLLTPNYITDTVGIGQRIWLLNSSEPIDSGRYSTQIFMTDLSTGLEWSNEYLISAIPTGIKHNDEALIIVLGENESELLVLNRKGDAIIPEEDEVVDSGGEN